LAVLGVLEGTEGFQKKIKELAKRPEYLRKVEWHGCMAAGWRAGAGARRAAELAGREDEVDDIIGALNMLNGIKERISRPGWHPREAIVEFGDE
jgi:hypothetical protein